METQKAGRPLVTGQVIITATTPAFDNATAHIYLEDISLADAPAVIVAETTLPMLRHALADADTTVPFTLITSNPAPIDTRRYYAVRVWIDCDNNGQKSPGDLYSDQVYPVLTRGFGDSVTIILVAK